MRGVVSRSFVPRGGTPYRIHGEGEDYDVILRGCYERGKKNADGIGGIRYVTSLLSNW